MSGPVNDPTLVELRFPPTLRTPFLARRLVGSIITSGPRLRSIDAALLAGEITTLALTCGQPLTVSVTAVGRTVRVTVGVDECAVPEPDAIVGKLLERVSDRWQHEGSIWFELDLIRRKDLTDLSDNALFDLLPDDLDARAELFERYSSFAASLSRRFRTRDLNANDLEQVALMGLIQSLERFDPSFGAKFTSFAGPTITGALKRYLRDHGWSMRVPRSLKEGALAVFRGRSELVQSLGREPTEAELAGHLDMTVGDLQEALLAGDTYTITSLDTPIGDVDAETIGDLIGEDDHDLELAASWPSIEVVLDRLSDREQQVLYLRFFEDLTQSEIASIVGVSQVHVSRLLTKSLDKVRAFLEAPDGD